MAAAAEAGAQPFTKGIVLTVDFKGLHEPQCKGVERPGDEASDYELWTPYDGRHGDTKCFMGQQVSYIRRKQDSECFNGEELERKILRSYCQCTEMDYECDMGYLRIDGRCQRIEDYDSKFSALVKEEQAAQCDAYGFYTQTQGYRKVPGNRCFGGLDYNPVSYSCSGVPGLSLKNLLILCVAGLALYFGWPVIEAVVIFLPLPDPKDLLERARGYLRPSQSSNAKSKKGGQYTGNFGEAPETLGDSDDEGQPKLRKKKAKGLSYGDSDEEDEGSAELINLDSSTVQRDRTHSAAEHVPKLAKPE